MRSVLCYSSITVTRGKSPITEAPGRSSWVEILLCSRNLCQKFSTTVKSWTECPLTTDFNSRLARGGLGTRSADTYRDPSNRLRLEVYALTEEAVGSVSPDAASEAGAQRLLPCCGLPNLGVSSRHQEVRV